MPVKVYIALGGNIGDVDGTFRQAIEALGRGGLEKIRQGVTISSAPVNCVDGTPAFRNSALEGEWDGTPEALLDLTQRIERELGRPERHSSRESRTVDLDILLFGDLVMKSERLTIPHPRMRERDFVMIPLHSLNQEL